MNITYALPVTAWHTATDGTRIAIIPDGRRLTLDEWKATRITPEQYANLAALKRGQTGEYDAARGEYIEPAQDEPNYEEGR